MSRFELKFNDTADWEEHDWLVLENGRVVQGFATSTGAERWIADRERITREENQRRIDAAIDRIAISNAERRRLRRKFDQCD